MAGLFDEPMVDMSRRPADIAEAPSGVRWDKDADAPVSGNTPAARNASATGAQVASTKLGGRAKQLMAWFADKGELTIDEARVLLNIPVNCVTGPWSKCEKVGWIEGTGRYYTYQAGGRTIHREYHRLTAEGQKVAEALKGGAR
jgi:hypothetical protein